MHPVSSMKLGGNSYLLAVFVAAAQAVACVQSLVALAGAEGCVGNVVDSLVRSREVAGVECAHLQTDTGSRGCCCLRSEQKKKSPAKLLGSHHLN
jgi:hypothetical protein